MISSRREFLRRASLAVMPLALTGRNRQAPSQAQAKSPLNGGVTAADTLALPVGRPTAPLGPLDNDPGVIAIERKLRCTCGCTLDVYTCRTTDFSCTYSPAMHRDVVVRVQQGMVADQIVQWFVAQNGETVLMAPAARGFNLVGYLVPGLTVTALGLVLAAWLTRRRMAGMAAVPVVPGDGGAPALPDAEARKRLRRALDDVDS